ncbi:TIR domain-containing protein [Paractinoplanes atraurantiacus]|uniref:WD40 repeat n=1 Tax=Paractinoplanes atraurantiacus TaxID=1036182 RepID=A0A285HTB5_9ACTN|nr:TIR domain-containing protein [Actinoplanes atraurantiacus]SNY38917.1 WD40 repeat [Actinoplanes atraurantiacus]
MTFDGFISYSHSGDGRLAPAVQRGLHRLAKPWHRRRALWIFRDQTGLAVTPGLWSSIQTALDGSEHFLLMASPEAAQSPWVNKEIEHWIATKSADRILPVVTDGEWDWDEKRGDFTEGSTAVPPALRGVFSEEPFFLDLRWARGTEHLSLRHSRFRDAIAQLAAPMHGVSKDELEGEDVRQHRRARRLLSGAAVTLVVLAVLASVTGLSAVRNGERARAAAAESLRQQQLAGDQRALAEQSAAEARRQQDLAKDQQARAARAGAAAEASERMAQEQQELADEATALAARQRQLAAQAAVRTEQQQRLAAQASELARQLQQEALGLKEEAQRQAKIAAEQQRLARQAATEAKAQQAKADQQQRVAVSRRLMNQATTTIVDDPKTALMLGAAAQRLNPDAATRRQLTGVVTSTSYAGTLGGAVASAYGPDGVLVSLGSDGRVALWNVADPRKPARIATLPEKASGRILALGPDGRTLAVVNAQGKAVLWDVTKRSKPARLATLPTDRTVTALVFGGGLLVTGDAAGGTAVWDLTDRAQPALQSKPTDQDTYPVLHLALSPNGRLLIVDKARFVPVFDLSEPADPADLDGFLSFGASPMAFSPDGATLAVGLDEGSVALWNMKNRTPKMAVQGVPPGPGEDDDPADSSPPPGFPDMPDEDDDPYDTRTGLSGQVTSLAYSADGSLLAAGDQNGTAALWDESATRSPGAIATVKAHGPVTAVSLAPGAGTLVTADASGTGTLWKVTPPGAPTSLATLAVPGGNAEATVFGPDGRSLVAAGSNGTASTWNTANPSRPVRGADRTLRDESVRAVAFGPDRRTVATVTAKSGTLRVGATTLTTLPDEVRGTNAMAFSPDGRTLAVVADSTTMMLWDVSNRARPVLRARLTGSFGTAVAFSPDGTALATGGDSDPSVTLWSLADRAAPARLAALTGHSDAVQSIAFTPDGHTLASGGFDKTTLLWDVTDRARPLRLASLPSKGGWVRSVAFSPNGRTLATGEAGYTTTLWDTAVPAAPIQLGTVRSSKGAEVRQVTFGGDGRTLAVTSQSVREPATVTLWSYSKLNSLRADPAGYACAITGRGLTSAEWARFVPELKYRRTCGG